jgi:hypothetical protein
MKTKHLTLLLILSLILNAYAILRIGSLSRDLSQQSNQLQFQLQGMDSQINGISYTIEQKLNEQASLLTSHTLDFGDMDPETLKVPVRVTVTPKRIQDGTMAKLIINGQEAIMTSGSSYALEGTVEVSVFEELHPTIVFENGDVKELETLMTYGPLRYDYLPNMGASYNGQISNTPNTNKWRLQGEVHIALDPNKYQTDVKSVRLVELLDGVPVKSHETALNMDIMIPLNEEITIEKGQTYALMAVMEDVNGLIYNHYVDGFFLDTSNGFNGDYGQGERITILDSSGEVLFTSEK